MTNAESERRGVPVRTCAVKNAHTDREQTIDYCLRL